MDIDTQLQPLTVPATWHLELETHIASLHLAKRSLTLANQHIRVFALWHQAQFNEPFEPHQITNYALLTYRHHSLEQARLAAATWNSRHWALGILCDYIGKPQLMHGIEQKDAVQQSELHRSLEDAEYHRLHQTLEGRIQRAITQFEHRDRVRDRAAVTLMLESGLRVDEAGQLDKTDIILSDRSGWVKVRNGKGSKERKVPLNLLARNALNQWLELRHDDNPALFDGKQSERLSTRSIQRIISDLRVDTRIPDLLCHSLRFDFAKRTERRLGAQGRSRSEIIDILMRLLGHSSSATTQIYLRSSSADLQSAVEGVE